MPSAAVTEHRARWMHNREFIAVLPDNFSDWMLTGAFYAAVHATETLIAFDGQPNHASHESRNQVLRSVKRYEHIWKHYRELYNGSQTTRYYCKPEDWIPAADIKTIWIPQYLYPLEKSVLKLMGDSQHLPLIWGAPPTATKVR
jgi:hypothetical protein